MKNYWISQYNESNLKGSRLLSNYDILVDWMKYTEDEAKEIDYIRLTNLMYAKNGSKTSAY